MNISEKIDFFCGYFRDQAKIIDALNVNVSALRTTDHERHQTRFFKKVLLITSLDTLAGIRYSKERYPQLNKRNQERFIKFLFESGVWPEGSLVSIPFLAEHTNNGKIPNGKLNDFIKSKLAANHEEGAFNIPAKNIDVSPDTLLSLATTEQEEKAIRENHHYELLYRYRNYLVHESREPGYAMEVVPENEPYYHGYIGDPRLYLAYPEGLFKKIFEAAVLYIENYLKSNNLDPYNFVTETTRW